MGKDEQQISYATNKKNLQKSKIVFVGDQYVGKTSVITRFIKDTFDSQRNPTIGIDFISKNISLGGKMMRLQLWDTAGQQRFRSLIPNYIRDCHAALIIFDLTNQQSFQNIQKWIDFVKQHRGQDVFIIAVGNKLDLKQDRVVSYQIASQKFKGLGVKYFQVSAKNGQNIEKMFQEICAELMHIDPQTNPPLQIMQSKVVTNVQIQKQKSNNNANKIEKKQERVMRKVEPPTKLTKNAIQKDQRRVKQKQCC